MRYTHLLFDADNTLWDFSAAEAAALERVLTERDLPWSAEVLATYRLINHEAWADYEAGRLPKEQLRTARFRRLLEHYRHNHPAEELSLDYRTYLGQSTRLLEGAVDVLKAMHGNYRLGLITNGLSEVQRPRLRNTSLSKYFDFIAISDELGVAKPQAAFFEHAHRQMDAPERERVLVIGDNPNADIRGARAFGYHACWLRHPGAADRSDLDETMRIRDIRELLQLL